MKLMFLCGSVEIGKDGVGDYTRRLGIALVTQGHEVKIVALNDTVPEISESLVVNAEDQIEVVRYSCSSTWENRIAKLDRVLNIFRPDWISLQYVPYSFQKKGSPYNFAKSLKGITKSWQWHVMFHETWTGISSRSPVKHKLVGFFQKKIAQLLIQNLRPKRISTSNKLYQIILDRANIQTSIVPIFSNIPLTVSSSDFLTELLKKLEIGHSDRDGHILLGIFGKLHQGYDLQPVINEELSKSNALNKKLVFVAFGRIGGLDEFNRLKAIFQSQVDFFHLGELPEEEVSHMLQILDVNISCTPLEHIGKSGVYAAMRLHDVKVLLPFSDNIPELEREINEYNNYLHSRLPHKWGVEYVAAKFIRFLEKV